MRIRALLFIPALAAAALAVGVSSASAATLFTTNGHGTRVTVGATATATSSGPFVLTNAAGLVSNACTHITLHLRLAENTVARSTLDVIAGTVAPGCAPSQFTTTHVPPWKLTVTGAGTMIGNSTSFAGTLDSIALDFAGVPGIFAGNLEGLTVTQNTTTTNGICIDANRAGTVTNPTVGLSANIDARFCLTAANSANAWSLT